MRMGHADIGGIADIGQAGARGPGFGLGVGQLAPQRRGLGEIGVVGRGRPCRGGERLRPGRGAQHIAADLQVVALRIGTVGVEDEMPAQRHIARARDRALLRGRAVGGDRIHVIAILGQGARDALVDHVDHAADRRRAIEQHRRTAQHLDALGQQRIDDHRMIGRGVRDVDRADPVGEHADALALEAAQDRARGTGTEGRGRDARLLGQRLADAGAQIAGEHFARDDRSAGEHIPLAGRQDTGDDDLVALVAGRALPVRAAIVRGGGLGRGRRRVVAVGAGGVRGSGDGERERSRAQQEQMTHGN